mmetsp:Transcript_63/g.172  ORF Transcript_63/g.172 Transcript_63/m.172 type:complete len:665 (-) Transcript_63:50-2044(-)
MSRRSSDWIARRLQDLDSDSYRTRAKALRWLGRLDEAELMECASPITYRLQDENWKVRLAAAEVLGTLQHLAISTQALQRLLQDEHWQVRHTTVVALGNLRPETLRECARNIVGRLEDADWRVRIVTLGVLSKLAPEVLLTYLGQIAQLLTDTHGSVRRQVVDVLREPLLRELSCRDSIDKPSSPSSASTVAFDPVMSAELEEARVAAALPLSELLLDDDGASFVASMIEPPLKAHTESTAVESGYGSDGAGESGMSTREEGDTTDVPASGAEDDASESRARSTGRSSSALSPELQEAKGEVVRMLCELYLHGKAGMYRILSFVRPDLDLDILTKACQLVATESHNTTFMNLASEHGCVEVVRSLVRTQHILINSKNPWYETPLHVAAREGHLDVCQVLVGAGALLKAKNSRRCTPTEVAQYRGHEAVVNFLESRENMTTVRGGTGDALLEAMSETRPIKKVEWYKIALPGFAGKVGAYHSLLAVTVGTADESHSYVIEKAALARSAGAEDAERAKNGVHVSHWLDVVPNVEHDPIYTLEAQSIMNNTSEDTLSLAALRRIAVDLGPYNVAACNCHHAALAVYNACAKPERRVPRIPNALLVLTCRFLQGVGVDVATSESAASRSAPQFDSRSASAVSTSAAGSTSSSPAVRSSVSEESARDDI